MTITDSSLPYWAWEHCCCVIPENSYLIMDYSVKTFLHYHILIWLRNVFSFFINVYYSLRLAAIKKQNKSYNNSGSGLPHLCSPIFKSKEILGEISFLTALRSSNVPKAYETLGFRTSAFHDRRLNSVIFHESKSKQMWPRVCSLTHTRACESF